VRPHRDGADRHVATQLSQLEAIAAERASLDERERIAIDYARELRITWAQIAAALGLHHRQGAQQRHRRLQQDSPAEPGKDPREIAERVVEAATQARRQLVGIGPHGKRAGAQRDLDRAVIDMQRCLIDVLNRGDIADLQNQRSEDQSAMDQQLATGWETHAIYCASKLRTVADRITALARMHAQAVSDHTSARQESRRPA